MTNPWMADDMIFQMYQFLTSRFIISVCRLVSKQWNLKAIEVSLTLDYSNLCLRPRLDELLLDDGGTTAQTNSLIPHLFIQNITCLNLSNNLLGPDHLNTLACCEYLNNLKSLDISENSIVENCESSSEVIYLLVSSKFMSNLTCLNVGATKLKDDGALMIATSPYMSNLRELYLRANLMTNSGVEAIANSKILSNLTTLDLSGNHITPEGVLCLTQSSNMKNLTDLNLNGNKVSLEGVVYITSSKYLKNLRKLHLAYASINDEAVEALCRSMSMCNLTELNLIGNSKRFSMTLKPCITTKSITIISSSVFKNHLHNLSISIDDIDMTSMKELTESSKHLRTLELIGCNIHEEAGTFIMQSSHLLNVTNLSLRYNQLDGTLFFNNYISTNHFEKLTCIDLSFNSIKAEGAVLMSQCSRLRNVKELDLSHNEIGDQGLSALASSQYLSKLTRLKLDHNRIGNHGVVALCKSECPLKSLTHLDLSWNSQIYSEGGVSIANSANMKNLTFLHFHNCNIGTKGAQAIASSEFMQNLTELHVPYNCIATKGALAIASSQHLKKLRVLSMQGNVIGANAYEVTAEKLSTFKHLTTISIQRPRR
ncbi:hypothetical protein C9374_004832 [Naegleria lovaniensis]|uniref:Uncharacterized protein n=1 Tax=Naegleria lovaniensis TaxID=51637 RepID=A0AA88KKR2_NAELO|nr:uncharacterized protein C9374_004832 [Naegleria lovaniensis]KAG2382865.1 hypothetical protein C9374_004832 [Naegleria lovaniensis]